MLELVFYATLKNLGCKCGAGAPACEMLADESVCPTQQVLNKYRNVFEMGITFQIQSHLHSVLNTDRNGYSSQDRKVRPS